MYQNVCIKLCKILYFYIKSYIFIWKNAIRNCPDLGSLVQHSAPSTPNSVSLTLHRKYRKYRKYIGKYRKYIRKYRKIKKNKGKIKERSRKKIQNFRTKNRKNKKNGGGGPKGGPTPFFIFLMFFGS